MQVQVSFTGDIQKVAGILAKLTVEGVEVNSVMATGDEKPKRHRRTKAEIAAAEAADNGEDAGVQEDEEPGTDGEGDDADVDLGLDDEEPVKPAKAAKAPKLTLDKDIIPACQAFVNKTGDKAKLAKVLATFGVKSVRDVKVEQYADLLKKIK